MTQWDKWLKQGNNSSSKKSKAMFDDEYEDDMPRKSKEKHKSHRTRHSNKHQDGEFEQGF